MSRSYHPIRTMLITAVLSGAVESAHAATRLWPASAECPTTLQACADAAIDGDRIEIRSGAPIDEDILLVNRSLTITAADAVMPAFAAGRHIDISSGAIGTDIAFTISRIRLVDGFVRLRYSGTGTATFNVRGLDIERTAGGTPAFISVSAAPGATVNTLVHENRVSGTPSGINSGLIELGALGGTLNAYAAYNTLSASETGTADGAGIFVDVAGLSGGPAGGYVRLFGNELRGGFIRGSIFFSEGLFSSTPSTFSALAFNNAIVCGSDEFARGIGFAVSNGIIDARAVNNTISACSSGLSALPWSGAGSTARVNGHVWNNLIVSTGAGLTFGASVTPNLLNDYNLINATGNAATLGTHTITADARLVARSAPRLRTGSPAINAADNVFLGNALIDAGLPTTDADGLRRVKGPGADIGAYEAGDLSTLHVVSGANTSGHITRVNSVASNGLPAASLLPTLIYGPSGPRSFEPFGVYYDPSSTRWTIYNEALLPIASGVRWGIFVPGSGAGLFTHSGTAANTTAWHTLIDNAATNGFSDRIVLVAHNWSATPTYNPHFTGVYYTGSGASGRWNIANIDQADLPATSAFNVYAQPPSPNALRVAATAGTRRVELDHALVNGVACATIHATRVVSATSPGPVASFDLDYNSSTGRWGIYSSVDYPPGTAFNIVIDAAQVFDCTDRIFANGFDQDPA